MKIIIILLYFSLRLRDKQTLNVFIEKRCAFFDLFKEIRDFIEKTFNFSGVRVVFQDHVQSLFDFCEGLLTVYINIGLFFEFFMRNYLSLSIFYFFGGEIFKLLKNFQI